MDLPSLHPDQSEFISIRRAGGLYVDKTGHLHKLLAPVGNDNSRLQVKYVFLARPRRFGKTLLVSTLEAFFQGDLPQLGSSAKAVFDPDAGERGELFLGTAIEEVVRQTRPHPVVRLNMAMTTSDTPDGLRRRLLAHLESVYSDWCERGAETGIESETRGDYVRFARTPEGAYRETPSEHVELLLRELKRQFNAAPVVLIDEYDAPLTHLLGRDMDPEPFIAVLREFFGLLKHLENRLHFVFITGISRFAHVNLFSALNNLTDISWGLDYSGLCGFDESDMRDLLPYLQAGAANLGKPVEQVVQELRDHYNGYCFGQPGLSENVYNPYSLLTCLRDMQAASASDRWQWLGWPNYWSESGTPQFLVRMARNGDLALTKDPPPVHQLMRTTYDLNNIDYGSLMLQTGYFTLRLDQGKRLRYDYPNNEVRLTFASSLLENFGRYATTDELTGLHRALEAEDFVDFRTRLQTFMAGMPGEKIAGETDCHLILHALCQLMRVEFQSEVHQLGGRSDLEVIFPGHVCVFEFKYNQSVEAALEQIEARDYGRRYFASGRRVVAVGLNFVGGIPGKPPRIEYRTRVRGLSNSETPRP